jgi:hypothetical protein
MGTYDGSFNVAARGLVTSAELSYDVPLNLGGVKDVKTYVNYTRYDKAAGFNASERVIVGASFPYGKFFTGIDYRFGKNDPYTNPTYNYAQGLATGGSNKWDSALFMSVGYYF